MDKKNRKLMTRIGAGLMLGLSLFNFGAAWNKTKGAEELPRKVKNIRKRESEQLKPEAQEIADIAETEAMVAVSEQESFQTQQNIAQEETSFSQQMIRYGAITVWTISAGVFFTSMIFNQPFSLGKGMLSLLPGNPHTTQLKINPAKEYFSKNENIILNLSVDSDDDFVGKLHAVITYDPSQIDLFNYEFDQNKFDQLEKFDVDRENGRITVEVANVAAGKKYSKDDFLSLYFNSMNSNKNIKTEISKEESFVLKADKENSNILGKVSPAKFNVTQ